MRRSASFILLLLFLSLMPPILEVEAQEAEAKVELPEAGLALLGFQQGMEVIPVNGTLIPLYPDETVWLLALTDISVDYGPANLNLIHIEKIFTGAELILVPEPLPCCGVNITYHVTVTAHAVAPDGSQASEKAILLYVGGEAPRRLAPSVTTGNASMQIDVGGIPLDGSIRLALLKPEVQEDSAIGRYGSVRYRSVIKPHSTLKITYDPTGGIFHRGSTVHFLLISMRSFLSEAEGLEGGVKLHRDGIVAAATVNINETGGQPVVVNLEVTSLGEPGIGGDTPLQLGLHFLYVHVEGQELALKEQKGKAGLKGAVRGYGGGFPYGGGYPEGEVEEVALIPIYVLEDDGYTLLDYTLASEGKLSLDFTQEIPTEVLIVATPSNRGVTSAIYAAELDIPVAKITLYDGQKAVDDYTVTLNPRLPSINLQGVTYVIGEALGRTAILERVRVNNFTVTDYQLDEERSSPIIGFPDAIKLTTSLNTLTVSGVDEFGRPLETASIVVEKGEESYTFSAARPRTLGLPNGDYNVALMIDGVRAVERKVTVDSPQQIVLTVNTVQPLDIALAAAILVQVPILILLTVKVVQSSRKPPELWSGRR